MAVIILCHSFAVRSAVDLFDNESISPNLYDTRQPYSLTADTTITRSTDIAKMLK